MFPAQAAAVFDIEDSGDFGVELVYVLPAGARASAGFEYKLALRYLEFVIGSHCSSFLPSAKRARQDSNLQPTDSKSATLSN